MFKKSFLTRSLHKIFGWLPNSFLHFFGTCKNACVGLAMQDDLEKIESKKIKAHLAVCSKCWNYYNQMKIVNQKIVTKLRSEVDSEYKKIDDSSADLIKRFSRK